MSDNSKQQARVEATFKLRKAFVRWLNEQADGASVLGQDDANYLLHKWAKRDEK